MQAPAVLHTGWSLSVQEVGELGCWLLVLYDADTDTVGLTHEGSYMEILR